MLVTENSQMCPEPRLNQILAAARSSDAAALRDLEALLREYPADARLHFLRGSLLAANGKYLDAQASMRRAIEIAPDYAVARFQLGLLLLTSGEAVAAQEAWGPLHSLPEGHYLRLFVRGLLHMIRDEFGEAVRLLQEGIARNQENLPMNRDMQMLIAKMQQGDTASSGASSPVDLLLQQAALKSSRH